MKLPIEQWIDENTFSLNVLDLFKESTICYKNSAYRASLLLSYLGFLTIIKDKLNTSKKPDSFNEVDWRNKIRAINNHDTWEGAVYDMLVQGARAGDIFKLNDDLKTQLAYWRSRRNDAAHYKDNEIGSHHTEAFWSFVKSNVPKMAVNGGMEGLLNKFSDHFDEEKTAPGSDFKPLVNEIPASVLVAELPDFFEKLKARLDGRMWQLEAEAPQVFNEVFNLSDERILTALRIFLKDKDRDIKFLNTYPKRLTQMNYNKVDIRTLWKTRIYAHSYLNPFAIYCELLRNELLSPTDIETANESLYSKFNQRNYHKLPEESNIPILISNGFYEVIFKDAIQTRKLERFLWVNDKCDLIASMIEHCPLQIETVKVLCKMANGSYPSQWLVRELTAVFERKPSVKRKFTQIVDNEGIDLPTEWA